MIRRSTFISFLLLALGGYVYAQDTPASLLRPVIGLSAGASFNSHSATFGQLPGIPNCCTSFNGGSGTGLQAAALYQLSLTARSLLLLRLGYTGLGGTLTKNEPIGTVLTPRGPEQGLSEHTIVGKLSMLSLIPSYGFQPLESLPLTIGAGPEIGFYLGKSFEQYETLVQPPDVSFTGGKTRNRQSGDIPDASAIYVGASAFGRYDIAVGGNWMLSPELVYTLPLASLSSVAWKVSPLRAGIGLLYRIPEPPVPPPPPPLPPPPPPPVLTAGLAYDGVAKDGSRSKDVRIVVEEFVNNELFPFLPFVFFPQEGSDLAQTHQHLLTADRTALFSEKEVTAEALQVYREMLNTIGSRMRRYAGSTITITGCNNGTGAEKNNRELSRTRAESVKTYFVDVWGIPPSRIKTAARNLPEQTPSIDSAKGREEARRVEIVSDTYEVTAPILREQVDRTVSIPAIAFLPEITAQAGIMDWDLTVSRRGKALQSFAGRTEIPPELTWNVKEEELAGSEDPVVARLRVHDNADQRREATVEFPVQQLTLTKKRIEMRGDVRIDRFSLILFDFGQATIGPANKRIVEMIRKVIEPTSTITIRGYADLIGDAEYNRALAERRCEATKAALGSAVRNIPVTLEAVGSAVQLFDNALPEGRNLCRTVQIVVETKTAGRQ